MQTRTFTQRIGYFWTCIAPASILDISEDEMQSLRDGDEMQSLRDELKCEKFCFLQVQRQLDNNVYLAYVSASPILLNSKPATILLTEHFLAYALPYDMRIKSMMNDPEHVLAILRAHAHVIQPVRHIAPSEIVLTPAPEPTLEITPIFLAEKQLQKVFATRLGSKLDGALATIDELQKELNNTAKSSCKDSDLKQSVCISIPHHHQHLVSAFLRTAFLVTKHWRHAMPGLLRRVLGIPAHAQQPFLSVRGEHDPRGKWVGYWLRMNVPISCNIPQSCMA